MMDLSTGRTTARSLALAALAGIGLGGCNHDQQAVDTSAAGSYAELEVQLQNCASNALDCVKAADCDDTAEQACRDEFQACRDATRAAYESFHTAVKDCFATARDCAGNAGDAGADGFGACRDVFKACVQDNRPTPPAPGPCLQGLRDCVQAGDQAATDCLEQAHTCFVDRLPMCGPPGGPEHGADAGLPGAGPRPGARRGWGL